MQINVIYPYQVDFFWPTIAKFIEASQVRGPTDTSLEEIKANCMHDEEWRLIIFDHFDGAAVVRRWDERLHIVALGGKFPPGWKTELFNWLLGVARFSGLRYITLGGRKGWTRALKSYGFVPLEHPFLGYELQEVEP